MVFIAAACATGDSDDTVEPSRQGGSIQQRPCHRISSHSFLSEPVYQKASLGAFRTVYEKLSEGAKNVCCSDLCVMFFFSNSADPPVTTLLFFERVTEKKKPSHVTF